MLVLSRKKGQRIAITPPGSETIWVTFLDLKGGVVRLGIDAPSGVLVDREEVHKRKNEGIEPKEVAHEG